MILDPTPHLAQATHPGMPASPLRTLLDHYLRFKRLLFRLPFALPSSRGSGVGGARSLLISLPRSEDRRRALLARLNRRSWGLSFLDACCPADPGSLDAAEWERYRAMSDRLRPGQRGCFLSHRRAWLRALESEAQITVILEDDVIPLYEHLPALPALPPDLDLLYLHHFAQRIPSVGQLLLQFLSAPVDCLGLPFKVHSIDAVLDSHCGTLHLGAMPGCAYAVTRAGAERLLALFDEVGNYDHWDAIVLRHATSAAVHQRMLPAIRSDALWFYRGQGPNRAWRKRSSISLNAYALYPPLFLHDHRAPSVKVAVSDAVPAPAHTPGTGPTLSRSAVTARVRGHGKAGDNQREARTWLLCGIPRSGNGLCCRLADALADTVALSQPYDPRYVFDGARLGSLPREPRAASVRLAEFADMVRAQVLEQGRAPSHQVGEGLYDNIMASERDADSGLRERRGEWGSIAIDKPLSAHFTLFMSQPAVFSALLPVAGERFACLALVRNPLSLLASWQTVNLPFNRGRIAGAEPYDPELRRTLDEEPDRLQRQLLILEWFFARYDAHLERRHVIRYEDLVESGGSVLFHALGHAGVRPAALKSRNESALYDCDTVEILLEALLARGGSWTRFYRPSDVERAADGIRRGQWNT